VAKNLDEDLVGKFSKREMWLFLEVQSCQPRYKGRDPDSTADSKLFGL
jgi:hypothetical protein